MTKTSRRALDTKYCGGYNEQISEYFLQKKTVRFYWIIMAPSKRSIDYFGHSKIKFCNDYKFHSLLDNGKEKNLKKTCSRYNLY